MTNPSTSAEQIIRQAKDLGCEIPRSDSRVLIVKLAAGRDLTVQFDRSGRIREAAYDTARGVRRGIRPARVGAVLGVLFGEVYDAVHKPETEETTVTEPTPEETETYADGMIRLQREHAARFPEPEQFRIERLIDFGRNALTVIPPGIADSTNTQRRIDWTASEILRKSDVRRAPYLPPRYSSQLITAAMIYDRDAIGPAHAAQVLAREAIRLALNERLAEIETKSQDRSSHIFPIVDLTTPVGTVLTHTPEPTDRVVVPPFCVDVLGSWDRPRFTVNKWDNEEGEYVHAMSLTREEADALHTALGRTLLG